MMISFLETCSRIVLLHIQALLILSENTIKKGYCLPMCFFENTCEIDDFDLLASEGYSLSRLHLKNIPETDKNMILFGNYYFELKL